MWNRQNILQQHTLKPHKKYQFRPNKKKKYLHPLIDNNQKERKAYGIITNSMETKAKLVFKLQINHKILFYALTIKCLATQKRERERERS